MLGAYSKKIVRKYSYVIVVIFLLFSVGCTKNEAETSANDQENTMIKNSKIRDYRVENKEYYEELARTTYNSIGYDDNTEKRTYSFKDLDLDKLDDDQYYKTVRSMFTLAMQGANDKADSKSYIEKDTKELAEKITELDKLNKKYNIEVK